MKITIFVLCLNLSGILIGGEALAYQTPDPACKTIKTDFEAVKAKISALQYAVSPAQAMIDIAAYQNAQNIDLCKNLKPTASDYQTNKTKCDKIKAAYDAAIASDTAYKNQFGILSAQEKGQKATYTLCLSSCNDFFYEKIQTSGKMKQIEQTLNISPAKTCDASNQLVSKDLGGVKQSIRQLMNDLVHAQKDLAQAQVDFNIKTKEFKDLLDAKKGSQKWRAKINAEKALTKSNEAKGDANHKVALIQDKLITEKAKYTKTATTLQNCEALDPKYKQLVQTLAELKKKVFPQQDQDNCQAFKSGS